MYSDVGPSDDPAEAVDRYLRRAVPFGFSGAVLVAEGGDVRLARGYGYADPDAGRPNRSSTVFSLGSVTKPLTATAVLALVDRGRLALADRLVDRLPGVPDTHASVTVEQLLSHTAGLPDATGDDFDSGTRGEVLEAIFETPLRFPPGSAYAYSNCGYSVLAAIVEDLTGEPFEHGLRRLVLDPAGMRSTGYRLPGWERSDLAHFFVGDTDVGVHVDKEFPSWHVMGNGEMLSTVHDLHQLTRALASGSLLRSPTLADAFTTRRNGYGLGWSIADGPPGPTVGHDGASTNGVSAFLRWFRDSDTVIAMLCNRDYSGGFLVHAVGPRVEQLAFGGTVPMPPEAAAAAEAHRATPMGTYVTDTGDRVTVRRTPDGLATDVAGQTVLDLLSGAESDPGQAETNRATLAMVRALVGGNVTSLLDLLAGDQERLARYRSFVTERLGSDPASIQFDGSMPVTLSTGPAAAVQLSLPGDDVEQTLRIFWQNGRLAGLGYGTRPLIDLPLVPRGPGRFALHHLALDTTVAVSVEGEDALLLTGPSGTARLRRSG